MFACAAFVVYIAAFPSSYICCLSHCFSLSFSLYDQHHKLRRELLWLKHFIKSLLGVYFDNFPIFRGFSKCRTLKIIKLVDIRQHNSCIISQTVTELTN